jgi:hypothetical protein
LAAKLSIALDGNADLNALSPQRLVVTLNDGSRVERLIPDTLGHPRAAMSAAQTETKRRLARELAASEPDPRLFSDPLSYFTRPEPA